MSLFIGHVLCFLFIPVCNLIGVYYGITDINMVFHDQWLLLLWGVVVLYNYIKECDVESEAR